MQEYLSFRKFITPVVIQVIFWVALVIVIIMALITIGRGEVLKGVLALLAGPIVVRIYCELIILLFRMYDKLSEISINRGTKTGQAPTQIATPGL